MFAALVHAKGLQTFSVHAGRLSRGDQVLKAPPLELQSLPDLHVVALHGVCPEHTLLPKKCDLHLAGLVTLDTLGDEEWGSALANLRSIDFVNKSQFAREWPDLFDNIDF